MYAEYAERLRRCKWSKFDGGVGVDLLADELAAMLSKELPLTHRAPMTISAQLADSATTPALKVNAYRSNPDAAAGIAIDTHGLIYQNGVAIGGATGVVPVGGVILYDADPSLLDAAVWSVMAAIQDRFVVGAGGTYALDATGGSNTHAHGSGNTNNTNAALTVTGTLSSTAVSLTGVNTNTVSNHSHQLQPTGGSIGAGVDYNTTTTLDGEHNHSIDHNHGDHTHTWTQATGNANHNHGIASESHLPPYYALHYITRIA